MTCHATLWGDFNHLRREDTHGISSSLRIKKCRRLSWTGSFVKGQVHFRLAGIFFFKNPIISRFCRLRLLTMPARILLGRVTRSPFELVDPHGPSASDHCAAAFGPAGDGKLAGRCRPAVTETDLDWDAVHEHLDGYRLLVAAEDPALTERAQAASRPDRPRHRPGPDADAGTHEPGSARSGPQRQAAPRGRRRRPVQRHRASATTGPNRSTA